MAGYKLGMMQIPDGARVAVAPDLVVLLLGVSRIKLAPKIEMILKYKVY